MTIPSVKYIGLLAAVCALYYLLPRRWRRPLLLLASYGFYCFFTLAGAALLAVSTLVTYLCAIAIETDFRGRARLWQLLALGWLLGALFIFKYLDYTLGLFGLHGVSGLIMPIGISFYTFTAAAYIFDVARRETPAERSLPDFFLFLSFFPSLLSGPINRASALLPQLRQPADFQLARFKHGLLRFILGAVKKLALADILGIYINYVYGDLPSQSGGAMLCAALLYSLQIYFDFAGYTDMALGAGELFGISLPENFRAPYLSDSVQGFWRGWHISLTSWFRHYLYIPLGGSRCSKGRTMLNILIVFTVSGLWHGAGLGFAVWGLLNGVYQVLGRVTLPWRRRIWQRAGINESKLLPRLLRTAGLYILMTIAWVFFRASTVSSALTVLRAIASIPLSLPGALGLSQVLGLRRILVASFSLLVFTLDDLSLKNRGLHLLDGLEKRQYLFWLTAAALTAYALIFGVYGPGFDAQSFVYFKF